ncbi:MAG: M23 family metallopeptidase [Rhodocyclaceae bacterium]|nr:M23 family metallopeptidase [Rhodocyclaceae bacterium]
MHGGTDITLKVGTPLRAIAGGKVIAKGRRRPDGGQLPLAAACAGAHGFPFWVHTKYQHLAEVPALNIGDSVQVGQAIALSGGTGTAGGHYGAAGYPHLHLTTHFGPSGEFELVGAYSSMVRARDAKNSDFLLLFLSGDADRGGAGILLGEGKQVPIAIVGEDGSVRPVGSKVVWPVACRARRN